MKTFYLAFVTASLFFLAFQSTHAELVGVFPAEGGKITIAPTAGPVFAGGIEFIPTEGTLTQGVSAAPFQFFIPNSSAPRNVTFGVLGTPVQIDGPVTLDVDASADAIIDASWGNGVTPTAFPVIGGGLLPDGSEAPTGPITGGGNSGGGNSGGGNGGGGNGGGGGNTGGGIGNGHDGPVDPRLVGTFPAAGGKLTVAPTAGPVQVSGIQLVPSRGTVTAGENSAPFSFFIPDSSAPENVTLGLLGTPATFDGPVILDVTVSADAIVSGVWGEGASPIKFAINSSDDPVDPGTGGGPDVTNNPPLSQASIDLALEDLGPAAVESQLLVLFPEGGGPLTIMGTNGPVETLGIEFVAEPGVLFQGDSAAPFGFFLENTEATGNVTLGSLGVPVVIDEPITLDIFASADAVLSGQWGEGNLSTFPAFAIPNVPEPGSQWLGLIGALGLLSFRRVREN